jgi:hypothetical protein
MNPDFIPAVCPNCGGKLQVNPAVDTLICQFCGTEHLIRRNVSGAVSLEAFARCPLCKRNDQVEKATAILNKQTSRSDGIVPQQRIFTDGQGHTYTRMVNVQVQSTQTSDLAKRLTPPSAPPTRATGRPIILLLIFAILSFAAGACCFIFSALGLLQSSNFSQPYEQLGSSMTSALVCSIPLVLGAVGMSVLWFFLRKKEQQRLAQEQNGINITYRRWQQALARWQKLYYCGRDDIVFVPGESNCANVSDMLGYLYAFPEK